MTDKTDQQTAIRKALLANGYTPLANVSKKCMLKGWPRLDVTEDMIEDWADRRGLMATGVRIEGPLIALDFDIDDAGALDAIWNALPDDLFDLIERMPVRHGAGEKVCLFCRAAGKAKIENIWSKAYYKPGDDLRTHRLEIFGAGGGARQIGAYGAHTVEDGEVKVSYSWAEDVGLADVPLADLPELTVAQLESLADVVSVTLAGLAWEYEVRSLDGRVASTRAYVLTPDMMFETHGGGNDCAVGLDELTEMARRWDGVRVSLSFREGPSAANRTRGLVSINPADDAVQIWDTMTGTLYRPVEMDWTKRGKELGEKLRDLSLVKEDGTAARSSAMFPVASGGSDEGGGDGGGEGGSDRAVVRVDSGRLAEAAREVVAEMRGFQDVFDMGGRLVKIVDSAVIEMTEARTAQEIGERFLCVREVEKGRKVYLEAVDPPGGLVKQVLSMVTEARYRGLRGVVDMPVLSDGVLVADGYDRVTQLLVSDSSCAAGFIPDVVGLDEVKDALETLWAPFREFPYVGALDRGGALACVLTAVCRAWLPTAPMFAFDAPVQGSGKSFLCSAIGALSGRCMFSAPLPLKNEDEIRKRLMSMLFAAPSAVIYDNQLGILDSASLAAVLTSPRFSDRELGKSRILDMPTGVLVMINGNNLMLGGDMPRRSVRVRIDPQMETPFERKFDFNPEQRVRRERGRLVAAALVLIKWGMGTAGAGRIGSFERWDEVVGQTVARVGRELDAGFGDPADVIREAHADDPQREDLGELLDALRGEFGNRWFGAGDVASRMAGGSSQNPLVEAFGTEKTMNSRSVGRYLSFRRDARVGGLALQAGRDNNTKVRRFRVWADDDEADIVVEGEVARRRGEQKAKLGALGRP